MSWKRRIYGLPFMRFYRQFRAAHIALNPSKTSYGFDFAGSPIYLLPDWELTERKLIQSLLPRVTVFIDVGANHGIHACHAAHFGVTVAAVEPEEGNLRVLKANLKPFPNAEIHPVAVSDAPGVLDFHGDGDTASLLSGWVGTPASFRQSVVANTLDNLFAHRWPGERLLIKIDVEGAEAQVIAGAADLLRRDPKPFWLIEAFPGDARDTMLATFRSAGYAIQPVEWYNFLCADIADMPENMRPDLKNVASMDYHMAGINFELMFDEPVTAWQAMEEVVAEADRRRTARQK